MHLYKVTYTISTTSHTYPQGTRWQEDGPDQAPISAQKVRSTCHELVLAETEDWARKLTHDHWRNLDCVIVSAERVPGYRIGSVAP